MKALKSSFAIFAITTLLLTGCEGSSGIVDTIDDSYSPEDDPLDLFENVELSVDLIENDWAAYRINDVFQYDLEMANAGPEDSDEAQLNFALDTGMAVVSVVQPAGWTCTFGATAIDCTGPIVSGSSESMIIEVSAPSVPGDITVTATMSTPGTDSDASNDSLSYDNAIGISTDDLQTQIDAALAGDTINVPAGDYVGCLDFGGKDVDLVSTSGADLTRFFGFECGEIISIGPDGSVQGFTFRYFTTFSGNASYDSAIDITGNTGTVISDNIFEYNDTRVGSGGTGISGNSTDSMIIERNIFRNLTCDTGEDTAAIEFINGSSPVIRNNLFYDNSCYGINMTLPAGNSPLIINNTLVGNTVGIYFSRQVSQVTQTYRNNIIANNGIGIVSENGGTDADNPSFENNLVFGNTLDYGIADQTGTNGNISVDPLFVDEAGNDYQLQTGSPAIDTGSATSAPTDDFNGTARPLNGDGLLGAEHDIGAFEAPTL